MLWKVFQFPCHPNAGRSEKLAPLLVVTGLVSLVCSACFSTAGHQGSHSHYTEQPVCLPTLLLIAHEMMVAVVQMVERLSLSQRRTGRTLLLCGAQTCGPLNIPLELNFTMLCFLSQQCHAQ